MGRRHRTPKPRPPLPREFVLDEKVDRARSCESKDGYPSEAHARATMLMNGMADALSVYRCRYCELWHLTRRRE
ncbi:MAG: hypothetical protein KGN02_15045 [bacterium]|nr:hypothetical protein [bacterium]